MNYFVKFVEDNIISILLIIIYLPFHAFFESVANEYLVENLLCKVESSWYNDFIVCFISIYIIAKYSLSLSKNKSFILNWLLIFASIIFWMYYRFSENSPWTFISTYTCESVKYIDLLVVIPVIMGYIKFAHLACYQERKYNVDPAKGFKYDNPITDSSEDLYNKSRTIDNIVESIKHTVSNRSSFSIGVCGDWGQGKTSFINLIENKLIDSSKQQQRVIVRYEPWINNDEKTILSSFFDKLSSVLELNNNALLAEQILNYADSLTGKESGDRIRNFLKIENKQLRDRKTEINKYIIKASIQIVVIIDDLDRLYPNEIMEVIKLIRNSADFCNTVFIVAYDKNYLITALNKLSEYRPDKFFEKIFQLEISLPTFEASIIRELLVKSFENILSHEDNSILESILVANSPHNFHFEFNKLSNIRELNRFVNSFKISYSILKEEILLVDLMNLELLRLKYQGVYNLIAQKFDKYFEPTGTYNNNYYLRPKEIDAPKKNSNGTPQKICKLKSDIQSNPKNFGVEQSQIEEILQLVDKLFPNNENYNGQYLYLSIRNPIFKNRYFYYDLEGCNISEIEFSKCREKLSTEEFKNKIKQWINLDNKSIKEIKIRFERITSFSSKEDFKKIIECIFYFASLIDPTPNHWNLKYRIGFEYYSLIDKIQLTYKELFSSRDEYISYIKNLFLSYMHEPIFVVDLIDKIIQDYGNLVGPDPDVSNPNDFPLKYTEMIEIKIIFLEEYCKRNEIDISILIKLFWLPIKHKQDYKNRQLFIIECFNRNPNLLKRLIIVKDSVYDQPEYGFHKIVKEIWFSEENFEHFLEKHKNDAIVSEVYSFFKKYKANNFQPIKSDFDKSFFTD